MHDPGGISVVSTAAIRNEAATNPSASAFGRRLVMLCGVLVALLAAWNCRESLGFQLLAWDDDINISLNPHLGPPTASNLSWMLTDTTYMRRYVPLGWLGFSSIYAFSGLSPTGYHVANIALHMLNSTLLFALLVLGLRRCRLVRDEGWAIGCATIGALVWSLHPFRAETIGWASGMLYGLSVCFGLMSVLVYVGEIRSRAARTAIATLLYACSLLTYPIMLGLLAVYFAVDVAERWQGRGESARPWWQDATFRRRAIEKVPMIALALAVMAGTVWARYTPSSFWPDAPTLTQLTALDRVMRGFYTWAYYLWKSAWPVGLTPAPAQLLTFSAFELRALVSAAIVIGITAVLWRRRAVLLLWLCYLAVMLPMLGLTEQQFFPCDRYAYLSSMVFSAAVVLALIRVRRGLRAALTGVAVGLLGVLAVLQREALSVWKDTDAVYGRVAARAEGTEFLARTYDRWARYHAQRGELARSREVLALALRNGVDPLRCATIAAEIERDARAEPGATPVAQLHMKFALDAARQHRTREAEEHFRMALVLAPDFAAARYNYAIFSAMEGDAALALHLYLRTSVRENAVLSSAAKSRALMLIARSFAAAKQPKPAWRAMERAIKEADSSSDATALRQELERYRREAFGSKVD